MFNKAAYYATLAVSALVGLWRFFVPNMFQWYDYLPLQYRNLIVGIDWTNYCFSAFLLGVSCLCLFWGRRALAGSREAMQLYMLLTAVWMLRACLAPFIEPWPLDPVPWAAVLQLVASTLLAALMVARAFGRPPCRWASALTRRTSPSSKPSSLMTWWSRRTSVWPR